MKPDRKYNALIRTLLIMSLTYDLKRKPTEEEIFEEYQKTYEEIALMTDEERELLEMDARARALVESNSYLDLPPSEADMIDARAWPEKEYE